jgi:hypothetical protein
MKNLAFVIWLIGWPTAYEISTAYSGKCGLKYSENTHDIASLIVVFLWVIIAILLWENSEK